MTFDPTNSTYTTPPRRNRRSRQTQTYHTSPAKHSFPRELSPQNHAARSASLQLPQRMSLNLLSLVSKFEALDAFSLPIKFPSMCPAPLQVSRNSSITRRVTATSHKRRLSTIFSPTNENRERDILSPSEDDITSERDTLYLAKSRTWIPSQKYFLRKPRKSQDSSKSSDLRMRNGVRGNEDIREGIGVRSVTAPYVQNETPAKKRGIRDMIRFYDGSTDTFVPNGSAHRESVNLTDNTLS